MILDNIGNTAQLHLWIGISVVYWFFFLLMGLIFKNEDDYRFIGIGKLWMFNILIYIFITVFIFIGQPLVTALLS